MSLAEDTAFVGELLDAFAVRAWKFGVAAEEEGGRGVPLAMHAGEVDEEGWVAWKLLPSTLTDADVGALEREFGVQFPPLFRAYLLARLQLFDQAKSRRYNHQLMLADLPSTAPLQPLRELLTSWRPLIDAGYVPFGQWGDGYGPMCFDTGARHDDGDCPIIWIDHEPAIELGGAACRERARVQPLAQPLFASYRELLLDVFGPK